MPPSPAGWQEEVNMPEISNKKIGEILVENGLITSLQLQEALEEQKVSGEKLGDILVKRAGLAVRNFSIG